MKFGSICSGIEAASTAWEPMGWRADYVADIEPFPCGVLAVRFGAGRPIYRPEHIGEKEWAASLNKIEWGDAITNYGDFTRIAEHHAESHSIDLLVGGTPCQAFSLAGAREGLNDARGNLTLKFVELVNASKSVRWVVWENVPGVLSDATNAFGFFLAGLVGGNDPLRMPVEGRYPDAGMVSGPLGRAAWRVLDAQHFGLAQRRRRVFVVFCPAAAGGDPAAILFERKGVRGNFATRREAGEGIASGVDDSVDGICGKLAPTLKASGVGVERSGDKRGQDPIVAVPELARCIATREGSSQDFESTTMIPVCFSAKDRGADAAEELAPTLRVGGHAGLHANAGVMPAIAFALRGRDDGTQAEMMGERAGALRASQGGSSNPYVATGAVRRLTPIECERLQGFPDDHTAIIYKGKSAPDGPRYKALGNSMAVPVMRFIGERFQAFEDGTLDEYRFDRADA